MLQSKLQFKLQILILSFFPRNFQLEIFFWSPEVGIKILQLKFIYSFIQDREICKLGISII